MTTATQSTLQEALNDFTRDFTSRVPEDKRAVIQAAIDSLQQSGIETTVSSVGSQLPDITLTNATRESIRLNALYQQSPLVLTFYRGGWCPYCNIELQHLQRALPEMRALGAQLVAISPEQPDNSLSTKEKNELSFEVLTDTDNQLARQLGLVFELPEAVQAVYQELGVDVASHNGTQEHALPMPATLIIDTTGTIRFIKAMADYTQRVDPVEILEQLRSLNA